MIFTLVFVFNIYNKRRLAIMFKLRKLGVSIAIFFLFIPLSFAQKRQWVRGIVRVNTNVSAGWESFSEVAMKAEGADLGYVVFSDQFIVKAEYGIFPFRHSLKIVNNRPSIISYGIENYLDGINSADREFPDVILIPGADIAPHYYWLGVPFFNDFICNQYSEQLTVIGPASPDFYRQLPVIHNETSRFDWMSIVQLLPLILSIWGVLILWFRNSGQYQDLQGNKYAHKHRRLRMLMGILMILTGLLWTIENRPFTKKYKYDQYSDFGVRPYQETLDYIRENSEQGKCGVFWSAPEATMTDKIFGVKLSTLPYFDDILKTHGHNGFAGIYGDTAKAHQAGREWDQLLNEYLKGKRKLAPVIIGELDYHGKSRKIDFIQTVVAVEKVDADSIVQAICNGNSYAYANVGDHQLSLSDIYLHQEDKSASLGESLEFMAINEIKLKIKGKVEGLRKTKTVFDLTVICNGKAIYFKKFNAEEINLDIPLIIPEEFQNKGYIRILLKTNQAGHLFSNPIYFNKKSINDNDE